MARRKKKSSKKGATKKKVATTRAAAGKSGGGRGRRVDPAELAKRVSVMRRVDAGDIDNQQAAKELGMNYGTWQVWKSNYKKRTGASPGRGGPRGKKAAGRRPGRPRASKGAGTDLSGLEDLLAQFRDMQSFGRELKAKLRELADLVESRLPG